MGGGAKEQADMSKEHEDESKAEQERIKNMTEGRMSKTINFAVDFAIKKPYKAGKTLMKGKSGGDLGDDKDKTLEDVPEESSKASSKEDVMSPRRMQCRNSHNLSDFCVGSSLTGGDNTTHRSLGAEDRPKKGLEKALSQVFADHIDLPSHELGTSFKVGSMSPRPGLKKNLKNISGT